MTTVPTVRTSSETGPSTRRRRSLRRAVVVAAMSVVTLFGVAAAAPSPAGAAVVTVSGNWCANPFVEWRTGTSSAHSCVDRTAQSTGGMTFRLAASDPSRDGLSARTVVNVYQWTPARNGVPGRWHHSIGRWVQASGGVGTSTVDGLYTVTRLSGATYYQVQVTPCTYNGSQLRSCGGMTYWNVPA